MYKIEITKTEENPTYDKEMKEWKSNWGPSSMSETRPQPFTEIRVFSFEATEEEFRAIKKAVLEVMN